MARLNISRPRPRPIGSTPIIWPGRQEGMQSNVTETVPEMSGRNFGSWRRSGIGLARHPAATPLRISTRVLFPAHSPSRGTKGRERERARDRDGGNGKGGEGRDPLSTPLRRENICIVAALAPRIHPPVIAGENCNLFRGSRPAGSAP